MSMRARPIPLSGSARHPAVCHRGIGWRWWSPGVFLLAVGLASSGCAPDDDGDGGCCACEFSCSAGGVTSSGTARLEGRSGSCEEACLEVARAETGCARPAVSHAACAAPPSVECGDDVCRVGDRTWQRRASADEMSLRAALDYCAGLELDGHDDWSVPGIDALRSLVVGCPASGAGGACRVGEACPDADDCWSESACGCSAGDACRWAEDAWGDDCDGRFWSATSDGSAAWIIDFQSATLGNPPFTSDRDWARQRVRCVRAIEAQPDPYCRPWTVRLEAESEAVPIGGELPITVRVDTVADYGGVGEACTDGPWTAVVELTLTDNTETGATLDADQLIIVGGEGAVTVRAGARAGPVTVKARLLRMAGGRANMAYQDVDFTLPLTRHAGLGEVVDVAQRDGRAFFRLDDESAIGVLALTDPEAEATRWETDGEPVALALAGDLAYVLDGQSVRERSLRAFDVSDPLAPALVGALPLEWATGPIAVAGDRAYVGGSDLHVVDVSDPSALRDLTPDSFGFSGPNDIAAAGRYIYLAREHRVLIAEVGPDGAIAERARVALTDSGGAAKALALAAPYLYVGGYARSLDDPLIVLDVSDPAAPQLAAEISSSFIYDDVAVDGARLFALRGGPSFDEGSRLEVYDVADPLDPHRVGLIDLGVRCESMSYADGLIAAACGADGLVTVDVSAYP